MNEKPLSKSELKRIAEGYNHPVMAGHAVSMAEELTELRELCVTLLHETNQVIAGRVNDAHLKTISAQLSMAIERIPK